MNFDGDSDSALNETYDDLNSPRALGYVRYREKNNHLPQTTVNRRPVKTAYFYQDGDIDTNGIRMAIHPNRHRSLEALLQELTEKMPKLSSGARAIFTPKGKHRVRSITDLENKGHYICSENVGRPRGIAFLHTAPQWSNKPPLKLPPIENNKRLSDESYLRHEFNEESTSALVEENQYPEIKQIFVRFSGIRQPQKTLLIRRRFVKNMGQLLHEMSMLFRTPVHKICTLEGKRIKSVEELMRGPSEFIACGAEPYSPNLMRTVDSKAKFPHNKLERSRSHTREHRKMADSSKGKRSRSGGHNDMHTYPCILLITSGSVHPDTGEKYSSPCTSNILLTVCNRHHTVQSILLRPAYMETLEKESVNGHEETDHSPKDGASFLGPFRPNQTDRFTISVIRTLDIHKIRLEHDSTGNHPEWLVQEVRIIPYLRGSSINPAYLPELTFVGNYWLSPFKADGSVVCEMSAPGTGFDVGRDVISRDLEFYPLNHVWFLYGDRSPVVRYELVITTGNLWSAGTCGSVSVLLRGDYGDSGVRRIIDPETLEPMVFHRGQVSVFSLNAVYLGKLRRLSVWLDTGGLEGNTWYLESITVHQNLIETSTPERVTPPHKNGRQIYQPLNHSTTFLCSRWLGVQNSAKEVQLYASNIRVVNGNDVTNERNPDMANDQWWDLCKWKFRPGTTLCFYSLITGSPLRIKQDGHIDARSVSGKDSGSNCNNGQAESFTVHLVTSPDSRHTKILKARGEVGRPGKIKHHLREDLHRFDQTAADAPAKPVFQFSSIENQRLCLALDATMGLVVADSLVTTGSQLEDANLFQVKAQPDHWIVLESIRQYSGHLSTHVYVGPDGFVVSGAAGPATIPGKLLMPYVKGTLRNQSIIWLCTSSQQTLAPMLKSTNSELYTNDQDEYETTAAWKVDIRGTGRRNQQAYWRVHRVGSRIRQFESVALPGHFLRVKAGMVDVLGSGQSDCKFKVSKWPARGFIQLVPIATPSKCIGLKEDGHLELIEISDLENSRFYPEVIFYGIQKTSMDEPVEQPSRRKSPVKFAEETPASSADRDRTSTLCASETEELTANDWKVSIKTVKTASNCIVVLIVYGLQKNSGPILIGRSDGDKRLFRKQCTDYFMIKLDEIGIIYKIRFETAAIRTTKNMQWEISEVTLENPTTGECLAFDFTGKQFERNADTCQLCREQPVKSSSVPADKRPGNHEFTVVVYQITLELRTPRGWSPATFEPHVSLVGAFGDSGRRLCPILDPANLKSSKNFQMSIECVHLGKLNRCLLGPVDITERHDNQRAGPLCVGVTVRDPNLDRTYYFPANIWLRTERTGQIHEVHLTAGDIRHIDSADAEDLGVDEHDEDEEELLNMIHEDAQQMIAAIIEKVEQNLIVYNQGVNQGILQHHQSK